MKKVIYSGFIVFAAFATVSCNSGTSTDSVDQAEDATEQRLENSGSNTAGLEDDADHMIALGSSDMFEIEAGRLASERATNAEVKSYAQMMVSDHTQASEQMKTLAQQKNVVLPTTMGNDHMEELNDLREEQGAEFDQEYMDAMVSSHEDAIERFEDLQDSNDPEIKAFAQTMLPKLQQHLQQAQTLEDRVNTSGTRADRDTRRAREREERGGWRFRSNQAGNSAQGTLNNAAQSTRDGVNNAAQSTQQGVNNAAQNTRDAANNATR